MKKRIFFFWGNKSLPWLRYMTIASCRIHNPDLPITLFRVASESTTKSDYIDGETSDDNWYDGPDFSDRLNELGGVEQVVVDKSGEWEGWDRWSAVHRSDIFRWHELWKNGGVYADMDILFTDSLDRLFDVMAHHDAAVNQYSKWWSIGLMAGSTGSEPFYEYIHKSAIANVRHGRYQTAGSWIFRYKWPRMEDLREAYSTIRFFNIPTEWVYAIDSFNLDRIFGTSESPDPGILGVHWYGGSPLARMFQESIVAGGFTDRLQKTYLGKAISSVLEKGAVDAVR